MEATAERPPDEGQAMALARVSSASEIADVSPTATEIRRAWIALVVVDVMLWTGGFARLRWFMGRRAVAPRRPVPGDVQRICAAVDRASLGYVRQTTCMQRSAAAARLLRRAGVSANVVVGCRRLPFYAHAWVEVEGQVVNDRPTVQERYPELERF
ncbi:MAG: lasso peptide biosynthesis B2 protein [Luteitalea sp.]|nr:lasso peptide biosynthesis B2 protein [Luteitalea sp.]